MPGGRPTKYTPATVAKITRALKDGCTKEAAAACGGIGYSTLNEWEKEFPEFSEALTRAEGEAEAQMARCLFTAAPTDWRAAESWLKRRRSKTWGDKQTTEISGTEGGPIAIRSVEAVLPPDGV